jgi:hypothetical protein
MSHFSHHVRDPLRVRSGAGAPEPHGEGGFGMVGYGEPGTGDWAG